MSRRRQPRRLASARAYYRLAVKADLAGQAKRADTYRHTADRLVREEQATRDYLARTRKGLNR